jgi:hypothetical protein
LDASDLARWLLMGNSYESQGITYKVLHCSNLKVEYMEMLGDDALPVTQIHQNFMYIEIIHTRAKVVIF